MKKNTILIIVIVLLWVAGGCIVYFGVFRGSSGPGAGVLNNLGVGSDQVAANQSGIIKVLPYGTSLDFDYFHDRKPLNQSGLGNPLKPYIDPDTIGAAKKSGELGQIMVDPTVEETK